MKITLTGKQRLAGSVLSLGLSTALLVGTSACSKKEEQSGTGRSALSTKVAEEAPAVTGILAQIPENSLGFFSWDLTSPAYQKLKNSPVKGKAANAEAMLTQLEAESAMLRVIDKVFDLKKLAASGPSADTSAAEGVLAKGAGFFVPPPPGGADPSLGVVFESTSGSLDGKAAALKEALKSENIPTADLALGEGQGFSFKVKSDEVEKINLPMGMTPGALLPEELKGAAGDPAANGAKPAPKTVDFFFAWKGPRGVLSSNERLAGTLVAERPATVPAIAKTPLYNQATSGLGKQAEQLTFGYIDLEETERAVAMAKPAEPAGAAAPSSELPVRAAAWAMLMTDSPEQRGNVVLNGASTKFKPWISALTNSPNGTVASALPANPLLVLSFDGKTISALKAQALAAALEPSQQMEREMADQQLAFLNDITRLGLSVRMGPLGQSLIPAPDLMIVAETSNPDATKSALTGLAGMALGSAGMPAEWKEKQVQETPTKYIMTPFGLGIYVTSTGKAVLLSSTEAQLDAALSSIKSGKSAAVGMSARAGSAVGTEPSIATLYLNFNEVASMIEGMSGMAQMFAPQGAGAENQIMDPAQIQNLKQMGTLVGTLSIEDGSIVKLRSFYEPPKAAAAAPKA
jgi:hypothetical protein